jgi:hypothetical protein
MSRRPSRPRHRLMACRGICEHDFKMKMFKVLLHLTLYDVACDVDHSCRSRLPFSKNNRRKISSIDGIDAAYIGHVNTILAAFEMSTISSATPSHGRPADESLSKLLSARDKVYHRYFHLSPTKQQQVSNLAREIVDIVQWQRKAGWDRSKSCSASCSKEASCWTE